RPAGVTRCRRRSVPFSSRRRRRRRHCFPATGTLRHVRVVTAALLAVIPHALLLGGGLAALDIDGWRSRCDSDRVVRRGGVVGVWRVVGRPPIARKSEVEADENVRATPGECRTGCHRPDEQGHHAYYQFRRSFHRTSVSLDSSVLAPYPEWVSDLYTRDLPALAAQPAAGH